MEFKYLIPPEVSTKVYAGIAKSRMEGKKHFCFTHWNNEPRSILNNDLRLLRNAGFQIEVDCYEISFEIVSEFKVSWS